MPTLLERRDSFRIGLPYRNRLLAFAPLLAFIPAAPPLVINRSYVNFFIYGIGFLLTAMMGAVAASRALITISPIQLVWRGDRDGAMHAFFLNDISFITVTSSGVLTVTLNESDRPHRLPVISARGRNKILARFASMGIRAITVAPQTPAEKR